MYGADRSDTYARYIASGPERVRLYERSFSDIPLSDVGCVVPRASGVVAALAVGNHPGELDIRGFSNRPDRDLSVNT